MPMPVPHVTVDISDTEAAGMRKFFAYGATNGEPASTPFALEKYIDDMAAVCGRVNIAQRERDKPKEESGA